MVKFQKKAGLAEEASWLTRSGGFGGRKLRSFQTKKNRKTLVGWGCIWDDISYPVI